MDRLGSRSSTISFVALERQLRNDIHVARSAALRSNSTEVSGVKVQRPVNEIGMVQDINCCPLKLEPDSLCDPYALGNTQVKVEVTRTIEAIDREIAESARSRSGHQTVLEFRRRGPAKRVGADGKEIWIDKEDSLVCLEYPDILLKVLEGNTGQLRAVVSRGLIESRPA